MHQSILLGDDSGSRRASDAFRDSGADKFLTEFSSFHR
jgi:hypothetical protein